MEETQAFVLELSLHSGVFSLHPCACCHTLPVPWAFVNESIGLGDSPVLSWPWCRSWGFRMHDRESGRQDGKIRGGGSTLQSVISLDIGLGWEPCPQGRASGSFPVVDERWM